MRNIIQQIIMDDDLKDDIVEDAELVALDTECKVVDSDALQAEINELEITHCQSRTDFSTDTKSKSCFLARSKVLHSFAEMGLQKSHHLHGSRCELNSILHIFWKTMATGKVVTFSVAQTIHRRHNKILPPAMARGISGSSVLPGRRKLINARLWSTITSKIMLKSW